MRAEKFLALVLASKLPARQQVEFTLTRRGRDFILRLGERVAYRGARGGPKSCRLGRVTQVDQARAQVGVHRYLPGVSGVRIMWALAYLKEDGSMTSSEGSRPSIETVSPIGVEMRDDPDEQEQVRRLRERGSHTSAPVAPPKKAGRNKASRALEPENTPPTPPSGAGAEARAAGVEFTAGPRPPSRPGQPIVLQQSVLPMGLLDLLLL